MNNPKQAILVVSFGTSYNLTRERTIDVIEKKIQEAWPQYTIRRAWTSKMIMAKLLRRDHIKIDNVTEAMERLAAEGFTDVIIQPTHVINGIENDLMKEDALVGLMTVPGNIGFHRIAAQVLELHQTVPPVVRRYAEVVNGTGNQLKPFPVEVEIVLYGEGSHGMSSLQGTGDGFSRPARGISLRLARRALGLHEHALRMLTGAFAAVPCPANHARQLRHAAFMVQ